MGIEGDDVLRTKVGFTIVQRIADKRLGDCEGDGRIHEHTINRTTDTCSCLTIAPAPLEFPFLILATKILRAHPSPMTIGVTVTSLS